MAQNVGDIAVSVRVESREFDNKMDKVDRKIDDTQKKAKKGGLLSGFLGGAVGGFLGAVGGAAIAGQDSVLGSALEALVGVIVAALLPAIIEFLVPALEAISDFLTSPGFRAFMDAVVKTVEASATVAGGVRDTFAPGGAFDREKGRLDFWTGKDFIRGEAVLIDRALPGDQSGIVDALNWWWSRKDSPSWPSPSTDGGFSTPMTSDGARSGMG